MPLGVSRRPMGEQMADHKADPGRSQADHQHPERQLVRQSPTSVTADHQRHRRLDQW
jgi:hypothetical protein